MKHIQLPILGILQGGPCLPAEEFQQRHDAALREIAQAYERALTMLDPRDLDERAWYRERLRDARCAAGLAPVELLPRAHE
ncbi:MAG: hypothetical protein QOJ63_3792 [Solirubrobacteraceae bacterium]|nr:hypothetical protein [Solirubrobacteraceae bacterium]